MFDTKFVSNCVAIVSCRIKLFSYECYLRNRTRLQSRTFFHISHFQKICRAPHKIVMNASDSDDCAASTADNKLDDDGIDDEFFLLLHLCSAQRYKFRRQLHLCAVVGCYFVCSKQSQGQEFKCHPLKKYVIIRKLFRGFTQIWLMFGLLWMD